MLEVIGHLAKPWRNLGVRRRSSQAVASLDGLSDVVDAVSHHPPLFTPIYGKLPGMDLFQKIDR